MRNLITIVFVFVSIFSFGQTEREMALFNEINNFRSNPKSYIPLVEDYIKIQESCVDKIKNGSMTIKSGNGNLDKDNKVYNVKSLNGLDRIEANIKAANELFQEIQPEISSHTNFQMAAMSLDIAVTQISGLIESRPKPEA